MPGRSRRNVHLRVFQQFKPEVEEERARFRARAPALVVDHQIRDVEETDVAWVCDRVITTDLGKGVPRDAVQRLDRLDVVHGRVVLAMTAVARAVARADVEV